MDHLVASTSAKIGQREGDDLGVAGHVDIFRRFLVLTASGDLQHLRPHVPASIALAELMEVGEMGLRLRTVDGSEFTTPALPPLCVALAAASRKGLALLQELSGDAVSAAAISLPEPVLIEPGNAFDLLLGGGVLQRFRAQCEQGARVARELTALRTAHENMQNAFAELESFVASTGLQPVRLSFENLPGRLLEAGGPGVAHISQLLPVHVLGISALELHLGAHCEPSGFTATLRTLEDDVVHASWTCQPDQVKSGWALFELAKAIGGLPRTAVLDLNALDSAGGLPLFSVGRPQPHAAYRARSEDGRPVAPGGLAMRVWCGLPGVRPPVIAAAPPLLEADPVGVREMHLPYTDLRRIHLVPSEWAPDFTIVEMKPELRGFVCHPGPNGIITMAKLESLSLNEPCIVSARATVPNAEAAQIEFGIAFSRLSDAEVRLSMEECSLGAEGPDFSFTGWRRVSFDQPMLISQTLIGNEGHLFFATRMADRAPEWYAWATFGDLRQTLLGRKDWKSPIAPVEQPLKSVRTPQTRSDPVIDWLGSERGLGFNVATRGVDCTPPKSGVALKRLPTIAIDAGFQFTANLCSSDDGVGIVEFGVVVTDLPPGNILTAVNARGAMWDETRLVFSGWRKASAGTTPRIVVEPSTLQVSSAHIFLMTRLAGKTARNTRVIASFEQMTVGVPERELEVP